MRLCSAAASFAFSAFFASSASALRRGREGGRGGGGARGARTRRKPRRQTKPPRSTASSRNSDTARAPARPPLRSVPFFRSSTPVLGSTPSHRCATAPCFEPTEHSYTVQDIRHPYLLPLPKNRFRFVANGELRWTGGARGSIGAAARCAIHVPRHVRDQAFGSRLGGRSVSMARADYQMERGSGTGK